MVALTLPGNIPIFTFTLVLGFGATLGLAGIAWGSPAREIVRRLDAGLCAMTGALIGGRMVFVLVNWAYFRSHLGEILAFRLGGLSWAGALAGGMLALAGFALVYRIPLGVYADALLPLLASLAVFAWLGCWLDGCAYGEPLSAWWGLLARDEWGELAARWPVQLLGAALAAGLAALIERLRPRLGAGQAAAYSLLGFSLEMLALSFLRADPAQWWSGLRLDSWAAMVFSGFALTVSILLSFKNTAGAAWYPKRTKT
jgi:phosphatidylglycerol:prolipoprotein diacylglycerol transferase